MYYYGGDAGELLPEEVKSYFLDSLWSECIEDEDFHSIGSSVFFLVRVDTEEDGSQTLMYMDTPIAKVVLTKFGRGIYRSIPVDVV